MTATTASAKGFNLGVARVAKNDEFYTRRSDIEAELVHYEGLFVGKTVYLNCDDWSRSEFFSWFLGRFADLGLARLVATGYVAGGRGVKAVVDAPGAVPVVSLLDGDGDFRSPECLAILETVDVVVTNPPFSLFREYVTLLDASGVGFLVMGSMNAVSTRDVFSLIRDDRVWLGCQSASMDFVVPAGAPGAVLRDGEWVKTLGNVCWYTNLAHDRRAVELPLTARYVPEMYPTYDNYDAIEVGRVVDIPVDYDGVMGVPVSFLLRHNPDQFEVVGLSTTDYPETKVYASKRRVVDGVPVDGRSGKLGATVRFDEFGPGVFYDVGYPVKCMYRRVFIRRR